MPVNPDNSVKSEATKESGWRTFAYSGIPEPTSDSDPSPSAKKSTLNLGGHSGFHRARLPDADGASFLADGRRPRAARKILGRLVSGNESDTPQITTAEDWHVGFEPGPGDNPAEAARRKPDYCLNVGITWPG